MLRKRDLVIHSLESITDREEIYHTPGTGLTSAFYYIDSLSYIILGSFPVECSSIL
jgi:hypothetical protein